MREVYRSYCRPNIFTAFKNKKLILLLLVTVISLAVLNDLSPGKSMKFSRKVKNSLKSLLNSKHILVVPGMDEDEVSDTVEGGQYYEDEENRVMFLETYNWRNLSQEEIASLSVTMRKHIMEENIGTVQNRNFTILIYKHGPFWDKRHIRRFGNERKDPFEFCSVNNCEVTYDEKRFHEADGILFNMQRTLGPSTYPNRTNYNQRWIWVTDESPHFITRYAAVKPMAGYNGVFNWSMCYRMDCDVPSLYGRVLTKTPEEVNSYTQPDFFHIKSHTIGGIISNCDAYRNKRLQYITKLKDYLDVDMYGGCWKKECPSTYNKDCDSLNDYKFFLNFENSNCKEFITEKVWWHSFVRGAIPIVMGTKQEEYRKVLPPNSFIHVDDFKSPYHLAVYLLYLTRNQTAFMEYHAWRYKFKVVNDHGYFGSFSYYYCRICEALNYNDPAPKVYDRMDLFFNEETQCYPFTWEKRMNEH